ncbi:MAG: hypothetical protein QOG90_913 [Actinomycetota bacterium]
MTIPSSRTRALLFAAAAALVVLSTTAGAVHFANADSSHPTTTSTSTSTTEAPTTTTSSTSTSTTVAPTTSTVARATSPTVRHAAVAVPTTLGRRRATLGPVYDQCDISIKILQSNPDHMFVTVVDPLHPNTNISVRVEWVTPDTAWTWNPSTAFSQSDANGKAVIASFIVDDWLSGRTLRVSAMPVADYANPCEPRDLLLDYSNPASFTAG